MNILDKIVESTKERIKKKKQKIPLTQMEQIAKADTLNAPFAFEKALAPSRMHFICEVKKASPSKGIIATDFPYTQIAQEYQSGGASAISCLTESYYFLGSDSFLTDVKQCVQIPGLRKDFIIDEYMIYESKAIGADAILLIAAILDKEQMRDYFLLADTLGLSVLVEAHNQEEIQKALFSQARIIGVNNRNLKTFEVDLCTSLNLRESVPQDRIFVSESGIHTREDIITLQKHNVNAVLIGESLMKMPDKKAKLQELQGRI